MDFSFTDEQLLLRDTAARFIAREYGFDTRRAILGSAGGERGAREAGLWRTLAELGLLALRVPEEDGGVGGGAVDTLLVMSAFGKGLFAEPYLASAVLATEAIVRLGTPAQRRRWLRPMAAGTLIAAFAHDERGTRGDALALATRATRVGAGYLLEGHKTVVEHGARADLLLVSARTDGGGVALFALGRETPGLRLAAYPTVDGGGAADVFLDQVYLPASARLGDGESEGEGGAEGDAAEALLAVLDSGLAAVCGEAVGVLERSLDATVEYIRARTQFGAPIATFQVLQHRIADMRIHLEQARSMACLAAARAGAGTAAERARAMSAAKVVVGEACRFVGEQAVQLHGGMGMTEELDIAHGFRRLFAIEKRFGSTQDHLARFARLLAA
ncbi:acyl-CoA dehydrogenase family protein [Thauera aromatica]|uniref:Pimeloyl-CoA dehydrogenase, small subunit n=1 Tax=Thauera aromatica K172 TaxID=44139 RepID=A0A2R4BIN0_THAAR|nr:acyl-CoA dehydrogenase [Thauera aromatica]AVR87054.1 pimeloyl-CoA dehydrogenase, small subunit [Thauera aromatica K172]